MKLLNTVKLTEAMDINLENNQKKIFNDIEEAFLLLDSVANILNHPVSEYEFNEFYENNSDNIELEVKEICQQIIKDIFVTCSAPLMIYDKWEFYIEIIEKYTERLFQSIDIYKLLLDHIEVKPQTMRQKLADVGMSIYDFFI